MSATQTKIIYTLLFLIIGIFFIDGGIQAIKTRNLYWMAPTISGFKNRKNEKAPKGAAILFGVTGILFGASFIVMTILFWL
jgi:tetrahydromethanopterin S-methyltransferase subunit D